MGRAETETSRRRPAPQGAGSLDGGAHASHLLFVLDVKSKPRTLAPPAKAWRNYYRVYRVLNLFPIGHLFPGIHVGPSVFASKEIAEEHAAIFLRAVNAPGQYVMDFAGSFPEGERAN